MAYLKKQHDLITHIGEALTIPNISTILLPALNTSQELKDNFGFVVLSDGSAGAFYTGLADTLAVLHATHHQYHDHSPVSIGLRLNGTDIPNSALALGAFNAISQHLMRRAGFDPSLIEKRSDENLPDAHIGMVGFFRPLIERYLEQGKSVTVIEKQPERVPEEMPVDLQTTPDSLAGCDYILCTASTLINNTIDSILLAAKDPGKVNLIGPSASGLPDVLFEMGIHSTGGVIIDDLEGLKKAIQDGESWGKCGRKYQLTPSTYPGLESLLSTIAELESL